MPTKFAAARSPGGPKFDLRAVALVGEFAETSRQDLRRGAGCGGVLRPPGVECVDEPRPRDIRQKWVFSDVCFQRSLREADNPERAAPGLRLVGIVQEDKAPGAEDGVCAVSGRRDVCGEGQRERCEVPGGGDLGHGQLCTDRGTPNRSERLAERGRHWQSFGSLGHVERLGWVGIFSGEARRFGWSQNGGQIVTTGALSGPRTARGLRAGLIGIGLLAGIGAVAGGAFVTAVARKVVTPPAEASENLRILNRGTHTITLSSSPDARLPGRYSLWFSHGTGHARVGRVLSSTRVAVTRELLGVDFGDLATAVRARIGGWFYLSPEALGLPYSDVSIATPLGAAPAWVIPASESAPHGRWMIGVHGRGVRKAETLRAVETFREAGYTCLLVSYRNDGEAPASRDGLYALGDTEWEDVDAALAFARDQGATDIVLMGWSMGGATVLQTATRSAHAELVRGIVLESPVVDWVAALNHQGKALGPANPFRRGSLAVLSRAWGGRLTGQSQPIDLKRLDFVGRSAELTVPVLLMHSADDDFVPPTASRALAQLRPDIVTYDEFTGAGHTRLWNREPERWTRAIQSWLSALITPSDRKESSTHH
jgi:pimeloyl-ACP methyl ester carboxylesterase